MYPLSLDLGLLPGAAVGVSSLRPSRPVSPAAPRPAASGAGRGELGSAGPSWSRRGCWDFPVATRVEDGDRRLGPQGCRR